MKAPRSLSPSCNRSTAMSRGLVLPDSASAAALDREDRSHGRAAGGRVPLEAQLDVARGRVPVVQRHVDPGAPGQARDRARRDRHRADPDRLAQVLHNLLANALRHTPGGKVTLTAEQNANQVRIRVDDTGEGIAAADLPFIFDRFYRADESQASSSGLGLAIAKYIVEAHRGNIWLESELGVGSTFFFTIPLAD